MGWGWCSGTVLCGDLAISRGVDVSFRSWDALLDRRLPVETSHRGLSLSLRAEPLAYAVRRPRVSGLSAPYDNINLLHDH